MRSSTLFGFGLSLSTICFALPSFSNKLSLHNNARNSSSANTTCATGLHKIIARASTEAPGEGIIGTVAIQVQQAVPGSNSEAVDYPAILTNYQASEASGVAAMQQLIQAYVARCPKSKIALLAYSQGAQVAGDVMCGTSEAGFTATAPLNATLAKNIIAVVQRGDPSHVPGQAQDVGNSTKSGVFPRVNTAACAPSANITQSFCNANDDFCDSGTSLQVHLSYIQAFGTQAAQFIASKVNETVARRDSN